MVTSNRKTVKKPTSFSKSDHSAEPELNQNVVDVRRVSKTVKGGRNISFTALVVVGDGKGLVGAALGRSQSVPEAVKKGFSKANKNMIKVALNGSTVAHEIVADFKASKVLLLPASPGTGIVAGGGVRAVLEAAGVKDVLSKRFGSNNPINVVKATINALGSIIDIKHELSLRKPEHKSVTEEVNNSAQEESTESTND